MLGFFLLKGNMKKKTVKKDFNKFAKRAAVHNRKKKQDGKAALERMVADLGVRTEGAKFVDRTDRFIRRAKSADKAGGTVATGVFSGTSSGFGFVRVEGEERDVFVPEGQTGGAIGGDTVEVVYRSYTLRGEQKTEGRVTRILEGITELIGTVRAETVRHGRHTFRENVLVPDDRKISLRPRILRMEGAEVGDKVRVSLNRKLFPVAAEIVTVFGKADSKEANYGAILAECGIETEFSEEAAAIAEEAAKRPLGEEDRKDLTGKTVFTIDGADAKDLDDAVSLARIAGGGWLLGVHIADVSYYVDEKTALDREVMRRGTSVYFTDKVVPMLPRCLSNGVCSLNAGEKKAALTAEMTLAEDGTILKTVITPTVIRSRVRGVYSEVNDLFENGKTSEFYPKYREVFPTLEKMKVLAQILKDKAKARGYVALDTAEAVILLDGDGAPTDIVRRERGFAEEMIEQFMLTANEGVASLLFEKNLPCVYRVHEAPPPDKAEELVRYLHNAGFDTSFITKDKVTGEALGSVLAEAETRGIAEPVSYVILRSMSKAFYSEVCKGHYGLSIDKYCHFTSPIRRLSDLATHRCIRKTLISGQPTAKYQSYANRAAAAASDAEIRALNAERRIENLYKTLYMKERIGEVYPAVVTSVTSFGVFCTLENTVEGLIPVSDLPGFFTFDEKALCLRSRDTVYKLGDRLSVEIAEADVSSGKMRFADARFDFFGKQR